MKNDTKSIIKIEMNNVDHANKLMTVLHKAFLIASEGGDACIFIGDGVDKPKLCGHIGHDIQMPKLFINFEEEL